MRAAVVGSGSWGTALAILLARNGHEVALLGRDPDEIAGMRATRQNERYLPGFPIPENVGFGFLSDLVEADLAVIAVPSHAVREVAQTVRGGHPLVAVASKGLEARTGKLMSEVVAEARPEARVGVISGPNLAVEIVRGVPTAAISAFEDETDALTVRAAFQCPTFRVYVSDDVVGVELAGALKNVVALGAGVADGLGFGDNTKGALLARGLKEMVTLGLAMGARMETFLGIAGVGDLFATAASPLSRNYRVGKALGQGKTLREALAEIGQVAEGVATAQMVPLLAAKWGVEMPVFVAIDELVQGRLSPFDGVKRLMERSTPREGLD